MTEPTERPIPVESTPTSTPPPDLFLLAGQGRDSGDGSTIDSEDTFGSSDGPWADPDGRVWVQTDGKQPNAVNNQMLAADPRTVDGEGRPELRRLRCV